MVRVATTSARTLFAARLRRAPAPLRAVAGAPPPPPVDAARTLFARLRRAPTPLRAIATEVAPLTPPVDAKRAEHLLRVLLPGFLGPYFARTPAAGAALAALRAALPAAAPALEPGSLGLLDHIAFRSFDLPGLGVVSLEALFLSLGYATAPGELVFEAKHLRARWYAPPAPGLPRVFVSELRCEELSPAARAAVARAAGEGAAERMQTGRFGPTLPDGALPWPPPPLADYELLLRESEYAAWTLVNGYALNHATVAVHRLPGLEGGLDEVNSLVKAAGLRLNAEGGEVKASPDGLLLQSSTLADRVRFTFAGGEEREVAGAYVEFAERRVLPQFAGLPPEEIQECHRRDGFETASADKIFESTNLGAATE
jgi:hypothetical protein